MGKVVIKLTSAHSNPVGLHVHADSPSFSANTLLNCEIGSVGELGRKLKGFPKSAQEHVEFSLGIGKGKGKAEFLFHTLGNSSACELWIKLTAQVDDTGKAAEAYFAIDYLDPVSIDTFARELLKMGENRVKIAELKNRFEQ